MSEILEFTGTKPNITPYENGKLGNKRDIKNYIEYLDVIITSIGIKEKETKDKIIGEFLKYNENLYVLLNNQKVSELINELLKGDDILSKVINDPIISEYYSDTKSDFKKNWDELMKQFVVLQGLIIIKKINKSPERGIMSLINALKQKLEAANNMIEQNIATDEYS